MVGGRIARHNSKVDSRPIFLFIFNNSLTAKFPFNIFAIVYSIIPEERIANIYQKIHKVY